MFFVFVWPSGYCAKTRGRFVACVTASTMPPNSPQTPNALRRAMGTQRRGPLRKRNNAIRVRYNLAHDVQRPHLLRSSAIRGGQYLTRDRLRVQRGRTATRHHGMLQPPDRHLGTQARPRVVRRTG
jgi:hypothetical protein